MGIEIPKIEVLNMIDIGEISNICIFPSKKKVNSKYIIRSSHNNFS